MVLLRYQFFLAYAAAFGAIWYYALGTISNDKVAAATTSSSDWIRHTVIRDAPLWAVVGFGLYALTLLVVGVATFQDRPDAAAELDRDVKEAKRELAKRGIE